jgi:hypothetical protein
MDVSSDSSDRTRLGLAQAVTEAFGFLVDLGFSQLEASPTIVRYRRGDVEVAVYHGGRSYELGFEVARHGAIYSISALMRTTDAEAAGRYRDAAVRMKEGVTKGVERLAELAKKYAGPALQNNPEFFAVLEVQRKAWSEAYALDVLEQQLRPKANEAFRRGSYREAAELYERIAARLTSAEKKKLAIAKDRAST